MPAARTARVTLLTAALALMVDLTGCEEGAPNLDPGGVHASHGGTLLTLPEDAGHLELLFEPESLAAGVGKSKGKVVTYFLDPSGSGPRQPPPTEVTYTPEQGKPLPLTPAGEAGRFESESITMPADSDLPGTFRAMIDGKPVEVVNRPR